MASRRYKEIAGESEMKNCSRPQQYIQLFNLRNLWRARAIDWLNRQRQRRYYLTIPIGGVDELNIMGVGSFFDPIIRGDDAMCMCFLPEEFFMSVLHKKTFDSNVPAIEEKDLNQLAQFLRQGDA